MELTDEQRQVVDHDGGLRCLGGAGTGKTTALVHRFVRLARRLGTSRILVLCRDRSAADRFLAAALGHLRSAEAPAVTTVHGLAWELRVRGSGREPRLLGGRARWSLIAELLAAEARDPSLRRLWPTLHGFVGRRAFVDEVAAALEALRLSLVDEGELLARAEAAGARERWEELVAFAGRYEAALADLGAVDAAGLVAGAARDLADPGVLEVTCRRFAHVIVDDAGALAPAARGVVELLAAGPAVPVVAVDPDGPVDPLWDQAAGAWPPGLPAVRLERCFRTPTAPELVRCTHPATEPEAVAAELLAARRAGAAWADMAVVVRSPARRSRALARALRRHGIPVAPVPGPLLAEPAVRGLIELLRWVAGEEAAAERLLGTPLVNVDPIAGRRIHAEARARGVPVAAHEALAGLRAVRDDLAARADHLRVQELAHEAFRRTLAHLVPDPDGPPRFADDHAVDAVAAFLAELESFAAARPRSSLAELLAGLDAPELPRDPWYRGAPDADEVAVVPLDALGGREWHTVVITGCVEGEIPRLPARPGFFDLSLLRADGPLPPARWRALALAAERRRFTDAVARAAARAVATVAPEPGQLPSRFVEGWPTREPVLPPRGQPPPRLAETPGAGPVFPDGRLRLTATRLATYEDCPLRYAITYVLGVREPTTLWAGFGTLVHDVLAAFCDPARTHARTYDQLLAIAEERWSDDLARFRPQLEEARRDLFALLQAWWELEGCAIAARSPLVPEVVAVERKFLIDVAGHEVAGVIDRIDRSDDGLEITDYKTGKRPPPPEEVAEDIQLALYHLAACRDPDLAALGRPCRLRLLYVRSGKVVEQPLRPDHEARTEARVREAAVSILAERFAPSPEADCRTCDFHRLCPLQPEGRDTEVAAWA